MRNLINEYHQKSRNLEPNDEQRKTLREAVVRYTENFLNSVNNPEESPAYQAKDHGQGLMQYAITNEGYNPDEVFQIISEHVDNGGINAASGGHLGYIPGGGIYSASLGDYWADITNRYSGVFFASPGAVRMENHLINWMKEMVGYPASALGNLASGGSIANLIAIVAARDAAGINAADIPQQVIYLSEQAHHCIHKAINIAGLRECQLRYISLDSQYRMDTGKLRQAIIEDIRQGLKPWLLIGSAGTTDTGAVDPFEDMADIAEEYQLWFHIDAAYGGFFMLTEYGSNKFKGIERSHSIIIDPHKGLFLPHGLGVALVRDGVQLQKSFAYHANYMQDATALANEISPADISPELTRPFRGLRMWLPLMVHGLAPFRAALEEKLLLAKYAWQELRKFENIELGPEPELSVVIFRFLPENGNANQFNERIIGKIHEDSRVFISSTTIKGVFTLRLAILAFRAHLDTIDLALQIIKEKMEETKNEAVRD
ncbi:Aromatic-L-amino-acid decarboxylase [Fulvivirga imtechensis AK7]|uniref:Aromatic-L-amino-acid decarboxylase n=1 Tax=Fulvivirga imtechensis AK7 TaxID=1237149 RepID=L8K2I3_9BACT|nr:pyridoxal-dependent decarboxylase [Fulvivirga imtechensis]ELR73662.1 Aromatic-L-amino-acid decarboxylase [Fulvivirga imtechensis AK7]